MDRITVRPMTPADAPAVAELSGQLGYPAAPADIERRLACIGSQADQAVFVAECGGGLAGWIHVHPVHTLESEPYAEIGGLVVDRRLRRQGAGRALVAQVERWAKERGLAQIRVRSNVVRPEAHGFYPAVGYSLLKTQHVYGRPL